MFTSSRSASKLNPDGSHNVFCYQCNSYIAKSFAPMSRALCEMCRRIESGEEITPEAMQQYLLSKHGKEDVTMLLMPKEDNLPRKFSLRSMAGDILEAIGLKLPEKPVPVSKNVAQGKKRKRLFDEMDNEPVRVIGSMEDLDRKLRE